MLRLFPLAALLLLAGPVAAGLLGILLPAFGYLPVLGRVAVSLDPFRQLAAMPGIGRSIALSLGTGLATTLVSFVVVMLFVAGWRGTRAFRRLHRLVAPLLSVPHAAAAFGLAFLIAPSGLLGRLAAPLLGLDRPPDLLLVQDRLGLAMTAGLITKEIPFLFLMALAALPQTRPAETERMLRALGYGRLAAFLHGVFPALYWQLRLPTLAVLAYATSVVDVALILGPTTPAPLAIRVLEWRNDADLDLQLVAAAGAVLQIGVAGGALALWLLLERAGAGLAIRLAATGWRARRDGALRQVAVVAMTLPALTILAGLTILALWSVAGAWRFPAPLPATLTPATWAGLIPNLGGPLATTVALAAASSVIAIVLTLGVLESWSRRAGLVALAVPNGVLAAPRTLRAALAAPNLGILYLPLIVPQVAFLFGLQILFLRVRLDGRFAAVLLAHLIFVFPYVMLSLSEPWASWDPRYGRALRTLGHGQNFVFWRARLPMLLAPVLTATALGFAVSVALYLPTLLIGGGRWPTITTEAVALASGGDRRLIGATALVQALLPFLGFVLAALIVGVRFRQRRTLRPTA